MKKAFPALCAALLALAPTFVLAQNRTPPAGSTSAGTAAPRGGDATSSSSPSSSSSSSAPSGSTSASAGGGSNSGSGSYRGGYSSRPEGVASPVGSLAGGRYAGPRSGESVGVSRVQTGANVGQAVPVSERPRGDAPVYGHAVPRSSVPNRTTNGTGGWIDYADYYNPYWSYSPFWGTSLDPYNGYRSIWNPWDPVFGGWYPASMFGGLSAAAGGATYTQQTTGGVRLKVKPKAAEVYIDGTYYGHVDDYDGAFQHLDLKPGNHRLELKIEGYAPVAVDLRILPGKTITYSGDLKPLK